MFNNGDKVLITGPSCSGKIEEIGTVVKINRITEAGYMHGVWNVYPASSLRLVEEELKIGDLVEVIDRSVRRYDQSERGRIFKIDQIGNYEGTKWFSASHFDCYPAKSLRKLTPEEVAMHTGTIGYKMQELQTEMEKAKEAMREILAPLVDARFEQHDEEIKGIYDILATHEEVHEGMDERLSAIEKRLDSRAANLGEIREQRNEDVDRIDDIGKRLAILEGEILKVVPDNCVLSMNHCERYGNHYQVYSIHLLLGDIYYLSVVVEFHI